LEQYQQKDCSYVTLGNKGALFIARSGKEVVADFSSGTTFRNHVQAVTEFVAEEFVAGKYDGIDLVYSEFLSAVSYQPRKKTILPLVLDVEHTEQNLSQLEYTLEPNPKEVFDALLPHYLENQVRDAILQAEASEYSAQMMAMHSATENAEGLISDLTLVYNKIRQEKITYEITDIITARLALN
jgi:F-type H+-transporting ATPase subunit gamma